MKRTLFVNAIIVAMICMLTGCSSKSNYEDAISLYEEGAYQEAGDAFEELGDYEDSMEMLQVCRYAQAGDLYDAGDYDGAIAIYETITDYEDSAVQISACYYAQAEELYDAGDYDGAIAVYETIIDYEDSATQISACYYAQAGELYDAGDYEGAIAIYETISEYKDSSDKIASANQKIMYDTYGDVIDLLAEETWFYNGGSDTVLKGISFTKDAATIQQVHFDGNGVQNDGSSEYTYTVDDSAITVAQQDETVLEIDYYVKDGKITLGSGEYFASSKIMSELDGDWTYSYTSSGLKHECNLTIAAEGSAAAFVVEEANEGIGLKSGEYYYFGPYDAICAAEFGKLNVVPVAESSGFLQGWGFNIIDGVVTPINYDHICSRGSGLKGQNGYKF